MFQFTKQEASFFDIFEEESEIAYQSAVILQDLVLHFKEPEAKIKELQAKEHEGDRQVHAMLERINRAVITPIDREDLFVISKELDSITDLIESTAQLFVMYNIQHVRSEAKELVRLIVEATAEVHGVTKEMKNSKKNALLKPKVIEVNRLENAGDVLYRRAIHALFTEEKDPFEVMRWKCVYDYLESALDACEHAANIILGVLMKHA